MGANSRTHTLHADHPFRSYAQNQEDVVLNRVFARVPRGHYVEVGAYHPSVKSVSYASYLRGWSGLLIEPQRELSALCRALRPRDTVIQSAISDRAHPETPFYIVPNSARSTLVQGIAEQYGTYERELVPTTTLDRILSAASWATSEFHFLSLDVEGSESDALEGLDLTVYRPWLMIVEAVDPISYKPTGARWEKRVAQAGYIYSHFDGVSKYFVAEERRELLQHTYPSCSTDNFIVDYPRIADHDAPREYDLSAEVMAMIHDVVQRASHSSDGDLIKELVESFAASSGDRVEELERWGLLIHAAASRARLERLDRDVRGVDRSSDSTGRHIA